MRPTSPTSNRYALTSGPVTTSAASCTLEPTTSLPADAPRLPRSARLLTLPAADRLATALLEHAKKTCFGIEPTRFHRTGRFREELQRALAAALDHERERVDEVITHVSRSLELAPGTTLAVQHPPYVRVVPPGAPHAVKAFHWDAYVGHPTRQWGLWVPLADVAGPEGLWLVDDDVAAPFVAQGALTEAASARLRAAAWPVPMKRGQVLVMQSFTAHGSVAHSLDVTRLSVDVRFSLDGEQPQGALGWRARRLVTG